MYIFNPEGFDPEAHLPKYLHRFSVCARMLVHLVAVGHAWDDRDELEYVPLQASILRRQVHPHATEAVRDALIACGVIECDGKYRVGQKCLGYRLAAPYRRQRFAPVKLTDKAIIRRNESQPRVPRPELSGGVHEMMWHWLNRTEIDYDGAVGRLTAKGRKLTGSDTTSWEGSFPRGSRRLCQDLLSQRRSDPR